MRDIRRWAVYFAPKADSALARFGADWLGWDPGAGVVREGIEIAGLPRPRRDLVAAPRKYGFHATLKAPFPLAEGRAPKALDDAIEELARDHGAFALPLRLAALGRFVALVPAEPVPALEALAGDCVTRLDPFRGAAPARDRSGLTPGQVAHLERWGYPFVLDQFRFHMTLTGPLEPSEVAVVLAALRGPTRPLLAEPVQVRDICLFGEMADGNFHILDRFPLAAGPGDPLQ